MFKTTGHVVGTALGYRLYRRPGTKTTIRGEGWQGDGAPEDRDSGPNLLVQEAGAVQKDQVRFETDEERESRATE